MNCNLGYKWENEKDFFDEKWLHITIQANSKAMQRDGRDQMKYIHASRGDLSEASEGG